MQQERATGLDFNAPEVIWERNKLVADRVGIILKYDPGKIENLHAKLNTLSEDPLSKKMLEYIYEKLYIATHSRDVVRGDKSISRDAIQSIITTCQIEAFEGLLNIGADGWG
jgi:hypothetical protein